MRIAWSVVAAVLTFYAAAAVRGAVLGTDRRTVVANVLLAWVIGWYAALSWLRVRARAHADEPGRQDRSRSASPRAATPSAMTPEGEAA